MKNPFDDLNRALQMKAAAEADAADTQTRERIESRAKHDELIKLAVGRFGQYCVAIVLPRRPGIIVVPKVREKPETNELVTEENALYRYCANVVLPQNEWPVRNLRFAETFYDPNIMDEGFDWHPNVLMQFSVGLYSPYSHKARTYVPDLQPRIHLTVWGTIQGPGEAITIADDYQYFVSRGNSFDRPHSTFCIHPKRNMSLERVDGLLTSSFEAVTPLVLKYPGK